MYFRALLLACVFVCLPHYAEAQQLTQTQAPSCVMRSSASVIRLGATVNLSWNSQFASSAVITTLGRVATSGVQGVIPTLSTTRYTGTFYGPGGTTTCSVSITFENTGAGTGSGLGSGVGGTGGPGTVDAPPNINAPTPMPSTGTNAGTLPSSPDQIKLSERPGTGLVPCNGIDCQACSVGALVQNIINFLLGLSIPLAAAIFAYAGVIYFSTEIVGKIEKAKRLFKSALIGFVIMAAGWLVVETVLRTVLDPVYFKNWNTIECVDKSRRETNANISTLINSAIPGLNTQTPVAIAPSLGVTSDSPVNRTGVNAGCNEGDYKQSDGTCLDSFGSTYAPNVERPSAVGGALSDTAIRATANYENMIREACAEYEQFNDCVRTSRAIMAIESNGRPSIVSSAGAAGLMQVMPATACGLDSSIDGCASRDYARVTEALKDPETNIGLGVQYLASMRSRFSNDDQFVASYNGGPGANRPSVTCPGQTYWQCEGNSGYKETRNYVQKFKTAYGKI